jgi:hypothetical protein
LTLERLKLEKLNTVLMLFRGFLAMDSQTLSLENQQIMVDTFHDYIMSDATKNMLPALWLSVIEICNRIMDTHTKLKKTHEYAY